MKHYIASDHNPVLLSNIAAIFVSGAIQSSCSGRVFDRFHLHVEIVNSYVGSDCHFYGFNGAITNGLSKDRCRKRTTTHSVLILYHIFYLCANLRSMMHKSTVFVIFSIIFVTPIIDTNKLVDSYTIMGQFNSQHDLYKRNYESFDANVKMFVINPHEACNEVNEEIDFFNI